MQQFRSRVNICSTRIIVDVGQSQIQQTKMMIVADACPPSSSICLVKFYPNSICVFCVGSHLSTLFMVGTHPEAMGIAVFGQLLLFAWVHTYPNVLLDVPDEHPSKFRNTFCSRSLGLGCQGPRKF